MYVKVSIKSPEITKVVRINADAYNSSTIKEWILQNEFSRDLQPYSAVENAFGQEILDKHRKRNFTSFQEYRTATEGSGGKKSNSADTTKQDRTGSAIQNTSDDRADLNESAFSMPEPTLRLIPTIWSIQNNCRMRYNVLARKVYFKGEMNEKNTISYINSFRLSFVFCVFTTFG
jgi:hypothetical protein